MAGELPRHLGRDRVVLRRPVDHQLGDAIGAVQRHRTLHGLVPLPLFLLPLIITFQSARGEVPAGLDRNVPMQDESGKATQGRRKP
ncbi:hypothetical protein [Teichococcus aestuarii]|uniref:hypothetical protein n=1 Tax=Teichococcus aestuarii TaxID=568898 RepID=UPI00360C9AF7